MANNRSFPKTLFFTALTLLLFIGISTLAIVLYERVQQRTDDYNRRMLKMEAQDVLFQADTLLMANLLHQSEYSYFANTPQQLFEKKLLSIIPTPPASIPSEFKFHQKSGNVTLNKVPTELCFEVEKMAQKYAMSQAICFQGFGDKKPSTLTFFNPNNKNETLKGDFKL